MAKKVMQFMQNKIVMITGASSGIGAACAKCFAENGANLMYPAKNPT
jgi:3-hydroxy acid dehydrogenase / malonic semialdehyde reductase